MNIIMIKGFQKNKIFATDEVLIAQLLVSPNRVVGQYTKILCFFINPTFRRNLLIKVIKDVLSFLIQLKISRTEDRYL